MHEINSLSKTVLKPISYKILKCNILNFYYFFYDNSIITILFRIMYTFNSIENMSKDDFLSMDRFFMRLNKHC